MRIAVSSDENYSVNEFVVTEIQARGHSVLRFGSLVSGEEMAYVDATREAATAVACGTCDEGIFFCWTGTGASIAANKVSGIRAALCSDAETARGARIWNHANVLVLSNRTLSGDIAKEILEAWFEAPRHDPRGKEARAALLKLDHGRG